MKKILFLLLMIANAYLGNAQQILCESFDNLAFAPVSMVGSPSGSITPGAWTNILISGTGAVNGANRWFRTTSANGANSPAPNTHSGAGMAAYNSYYISAGGVAALISPAFDLGYTPAGGITVLDFWAYNYNSFFPYPDEIQVYLDVNNNTNMTGTLLADFFPTQAVGAGWVHYTYTLPNTYTGAANYIKFFGISGWGYDMFLDDICINHYPPCTGAPVAGVVNGPTPICPNIPFTLTTTGSTQSYGITYTWEYCAAGANFPTGGTTSIVTSTPTLSVVTGITAATDYRLKVTCTLTGQFNYTGTKTINVNPPVMCPCTPVYNQGCSAGDDINNITLTGSGGTPINQSNTGCSVGSYADYYNSLPALQMTQGGTYNGTINSQTNADNLKIWIDFNDDGVFSTTEVVGTGTNIGIAIVPFSITIPGTNVTGCHRMRMRMVWSGNSSTANIDPCAAYSYGETHDYQVQICGTMVAPTVTNNGPICKGSLLKVTASSPYCNVLYTLNGPLGTQSNTTGVFYFPNAQCSYSSSYTVNVSACGFTSPNATTNVTVYCPPTLSLVSTTNPNSCLPPFNGSIKITGLVANSTLDTIYYTDPTGVNDTIVLTANGTGSVTIPNLGPGVYSNIYYLTAQHCPSNILTNINLLSPTSVATPVPTYTAPICIGSQLNLHVINSNVNACYHWSGPGGFAYSNCDSTVNTHDNAIRNNLAVTQSGNYSVWYTLFGCPSASASVNVVISPSPNPPQGVNDTVCQYGVLGVADYLKAVGLPAGGILVWYDSPSGGVAHPSPYYPSTSDPTLVPVHTYYPAVIVGNCESTHGFYQAIRTTWPKPAPPVITRPLDSACQFQIMSPLVATGQNINWYTTATGGIGVANLIPSSVNVGNEYYYATQRVMVTNSFAGCESDRAIKTIYLKPKPAPPQVITPIKLCQYDTPIPLTTAVTNGNALNLLWYYQPIGGPVGVPTSYAPSPSTQYEDSLQYWVTNLVNGCESDRAFIGVKVNYKPNGIIKIYKPFVCQDDTAKVYYYGNAKSPTAEYYWHTPSPQVTPLVHGLKDSIATIQVNTGSDFDMSLYVNDNGCVSNRISLHVPVHPVPKITLTSKKDICVDEVVDVAIASYDMPVDRYNWNFNSGDTLYGTYDWGPYGVKWHTPGTHFVAVTATKGACTSKPVTDSIIVHPYPLAHILGYDLSEICAGTPIAFNAQGLDNTFNYQWSPAPYFDKEEGSPVLGAVLHTGTVKLSVISPWGCNSYDSVYVKTKPCCKVYLPDAFTPNNDGRNDVYSVITSGHHKLNTFRIVNRWGVVMFETTDEQKGWDGVYNNVAQPMETYYYYLNYICETGNVIEQKGDFLLIR